MSSSLTLIEVKNVQLERAFLEMPWTIYQDDPMWVPPLKLALKDLLNEKKHPFYETAKMKRWLCFRGGKAVGRIASIINHRHNQFHQEQCGHFGFFECINDDLVANALIKRVSEDLRAQGMTSMKGPVNPSTNYESGMLIDGFDDPPQIMMTYNKSYYPEMFYRLGFHKQMDLYAYMAKASTEPPNTFVRIAERVYKVPNIKWRPINLKNFAEEVRFILDVYNASWEKNWGFVPVTEKEFKHIANDIKSICKPEYTCLVEIGGDPAGVLIALPDYNRIFHKVKDGKLFPTGLLKILLGQKKIDRIRVPIMGVKKEYRKHGVAVLMYMELYKAIKANPKIKELEMSWILENNEDMNRAIHLMGVKEPYKTYRIYEKSL
ncbi:MAG: hypothetical protein HQK50_09985 [Oligoflexia bacterium]|nr:hypothetical protein [Oligoflexia bacterium]MBF0365891.1 hypothetical protein [Oligoflexia bacterium]